MTTLTKLEADADARARVPNLIWLILFAGFWIKCAAYFTVPFLAVFLAKNTALSLPVIGLIVGAQPLAALAGGFLGGHLSDRFGRRQILFVSLIGSSLAYFGFFLAARYLAGGPASWLCFALLNLCAGWFSSFFWPVTQALIADLVSEQQRPVIYRYRYVITNIGAGLGPLLGISLGIAAASTAFLVTALSYAGFLAILYFFGANIAADGHAQGLASVVQGLTPGPAPGQGAPLAAPLGDPVRGELCPDRVESVPIHVSGVSRRPAILFLRHHAQRYLCGRAPTGRELGREAHECEGNDARRHRRFLRRLPRHGRFPDREGLVHRRNLRHYPGRSLGGADIERAHR